jgi:hypothetical protein
LLHIGYLYRLCNEQQLLLEYDRWLYRHSNALFPTHGE